MSIANIKCSKQQTKLYVKINLAIYKDSMNAINMYVVHILRLKKHP